MLESLRGQYDIWLVGWDGADFPKVNEIWGTDLKAEDVKVTVAYRFMRRLMDLIPLPLAHLRLHLLFRAARKLRREIDFDLAISCQNEGAFGADGIQYIHFPWGFYPRPSHDMKWYHFSWPLRGYRRYCEWLSGYSTDAMLQNLTLVNSNWTGQKFFETYGAQCTTLTPPVPGEISDAPWTDREDSFAILGRLSPEKHVEKAVEIS